MKKLAEELREIITHWDGDSKGTLEKAAKFFDAMPEPPDGKQIVGEYRKAAPEEQWLDFDGVVVSGPSSCSHLILRPKEK